MPAHSEVWSLMPLSLRTGAAVIGLALLTACTAPRSTVRLYQLRAAPVQAPAPAPAPAGATAQWQLLLPVRVPDYLDRDAILVPEGRAGLQAQSEHRWAEPLRDAVPRLLHSDLAALLGEGRVWTAPVPAGVRISRQWRVDVLALDAAADRRSVTLQVRWAVLDPSGTQAPKAQLSTIQVPTDDTSIDALVAAQREALWRLAVTLAAQDRP